MRFNFLVLAAVLPTVLLVAGAPVTNEVELIARGPGKTGSTTPAKSAAKSTLSTGSTKKSCPVRPAKKAAPLGRRANIIIGFTGTDSDQAASYAKSATRANNNAARLGTGLYLTDNLKLAEKFASNAVGAKKRSRSPTVNKNVKDSVCRISVDQTTWDGLAKIWIPKGDMINLNPTSGAEEKRKAYEGEQCMTSPAVRFARYDIEGAPPNSYELVIPPSLQKGLHAECKDVPQSTSIDSDNDEHVFDPLGFTYHDKTSAWHIVGSSS